MSNVRTIDIKGLQHAEREALIFPGVESLTDGDMLRIVVEFNPVPLVYMLNAQGEYDIAYEKEGPDEWILNVKRTAPRQDRKGQFKELLSEMKEGEVSAETRDKAKQLFQAVDATTLGLLEQELIREGISHDQIRKSLCDIHLEVMRDSLVAQRKEVASPHPVHTLMEEHKIIVESLNDLDALTRRMEATDSFEAFGADLERLRDIAHHLVEAESHHQREEDVLFPRLEAHDVVEPPEIMKQDHVEFRQRKQELFRLAHNPGSLEYHAFRARVIELGQYLAKELESHIFKEDNILYQIALQVLSDEEWQQVKRDCDKIGYCCFSPEDIRGEPATEAK
ncbi:MAG: DUF438 domain-containing protein [Chloroflexi bacterium]|nr:DUF438 domain-containing protein [Chloroflexota bacterium]